MTANNLILEEPVSDGWYVKETPGYNSEGFTLEIHCDTTQEVVISVDRLFRMLSEVIANNPTVKDRLKVLLGE